MNRQDLHAALRAAIATRRVAQLRQLLADHGIMAFAGAVSSCSPRVGADALSLLTTAERTAVLHHLPRVSREALRQYGLPGLPLVAQRSAPLLVSPCTSVQQSASLRALPVTHRHGLELRA